MREARHSPTAGRWVLWCALGFVGLAGLAVVVSVLLWRVGGWASPSTEEYRAALLEGDVDRVREMLAAGAPVHSLGGKEAPIALAAGEGHLEVVRVLLDQGAAADAGLLEAISRNRIEVLKLLVERGAVTRSDGAFAERALGAAVESDNREAVDVLLAGGAGRARPTAKDDDVPPPVATALPLHEAARRGRAAVVEVILKHKLPLDRRDQAGWSAADVAFLAGHQKLGERLRKAGVPDSGLGDLRQGLVLAQSRR